jgi:tripartite-type tricarboxylate transporter receptor subunit TctC
MPFLLRRASAQAAWPSRQIRMICSYPAGGQTDLLARALNRVMMKNPGCDMDKDLTLVSVIPGAGLLLVASPKSGVKTLDEFVAFARKSGNVNFGTYSAGSSPHVTINELNKQYGLNIEPIHYRGEAPMWTGLAEGTLDVAMGSYAAAQSVLQGDRGVGFAVRSKKVDAIPNVKTLPEQGATAKFFTVSGFTGWDSSP